MLELYAIRCGNGKTQVRGGFLKKSGKNGLDKAFKVCYTNKRKEVSLYLFDN
ncbi:MAG: hypothetical protein IKC35_04695 [Clostridia bacterium]|nr:hypothetical protein [Clostridia bacterium]